MQIGKIPLSASNFKLNRIGGSIRGSPKMIKIPRTLTFPEFAGHDLNLLRYEGFAHGAGTLAKLEELKEFFREPDVTLPTYIDLGDGEFWGIPKRFSYQKMGGYKDYWTFTLEILWNDVTGPINRQGLVLELLMNEGEGNIAYDTSGNGNDGTITGADWVEDYMGKALSFDGTTNKVVIDTNSMISETEGAISLHVKFNAVDKDQVILIAGEIDADGESGKDQLLIMLQGSDNKIKAGWQTAAEADWVDSPDALVIATWYDLTLCWSITENRVKIYIDTVLTLGDVFTSNNKNNWEDELRIGRSMNSGANVNPLDCVVNEVRTYNHVPSATEIYANSRRYNV